MRRTATRAEYDSLRRMIEKQCGIALDDSKQYLIESRLGRVLVDHGCKSYSELIHKIERENRYSVRNAVIDAITTNETLWFRDAHPFETIKRKLIPYWLASGRPSIRAWSAASSTGQEAYSLAMTFLEARRETPELRSKRIEIVGTDVSASAIATATAGIYDQLAVGRGLSQERRDRFFTPRAGKWEVDSQVKALVRFSEGNLLHHQAAATDFDLVLLRYVLIYFTNEVKRKIVERMYSKLRPGGFLIVGATEDLTALKTSFDAERMGPTVVYRKHANGRLR